MRAKKLHHQKSQIKNLQLSGIEPSTYRAATDGATTELNVLSMEVL